VITFQTEFEVTEAPTNISAREAFISPVSKLQYNEDIKATARWHPALRDD